MSNPYHVRWRVMRDRADGSVPVAPLTAPRARRRRGEAASAALPRLVAPLGMVSLLVILVLVPYVVASNLAPPGYTFRGSLLPSGDESQYLTAVRLGMRGDWLWHDLYMVRTPPAMLMYPVYLLAGHLGALLRLSLTGSFALAHMLAAALVPAALWRLGAPYVPRRRLPLFVAFALGTSGLYWLVALLDAAGLSPVPLNHMGVPDLSGLTAMLMETHVALGIAGQLMAITGVLGALHSARHATARRATLYGAAGSLLVGLSLPVLLPLTVIMLGLLALSWLRGAAPDLGLAAASRTALRRVAPIVLPALLLAAYYAALFSHGVWASGSFQAVPAIPWPEELLLWGVLLPLGWWGWRHAEPAARPLAGALALWLCCALIGHLLPFWQDGRLVSGLNVVTGALFALGLLREHAVTPRVRMRWLVAVSFGALCQYLFLLSTLWTGHATALYSSPAQQEAGAWLAAHAGPRDVVLAPLGFSNILPTMATVRVVAGHQYQTLDFTYRQVQVETFFDARTAEAVRLHVLRATEATLVVYDAHDGEDGTFDPRSLPQLHTIFSTPGITVLRVAGR